MQSAPDASSPPADAPPGLPANDLASAYQPRRVWAAALGVGWNLAFAVLALFTGASARVCRAIEGRPTHGPARFSLAVPAFVAVYFAAWSVWNFPLELYFGYLEERQFALAKDGVRAWTRDWLAGTLQHAPLFVIGSTSLVLLQTLLPAGWPVAAAGAVGGLFLLTSYFAVDLIPPGLFQFEPPGKATLARLAGQLAPGRGGVASIRSGATTAPVPAVPAVLRLPTVVVFSAPALRDFSGGLVGLGRRQVLLLSRSTLALAGDNLLRFILLHELGHRRYRHLWLATLAGWAWAAGGLALSARAAPAPAVGTPMFVPWLALLLSLWMGAGEPVLAYLGRRLEYQADRFFLRHGGTAGELQAALVELSNRNLARTDRLRRRQTIFHPLPSVANRVYAARKFESASHEE